tara:strand:+ start:584 stop:844 length:261 start_codon:yes stop_codon:yes gene_type:complete
MQFNPGNVINEYISDGRNGPSADSWCSSYLIIERREMDLKCLCIFDFDNDEAHLPGQIVDVSTDIAQSTRSQGIYWTEEECEGVKR